MAERKTGFVNVDDLQTEISLETACQFYGVDPGELQATGREIRTKCFLNCGRQEETGDRALAIDASHPQKRWRCHQYGCGKGGNLVGLCDLMKDGTHSDGRPKGERFKAIRADLMAMMSGSFDSESKPSEQPARQVTESETKANIPLAEAEHERVRALVDLDTKFLGTIDEQMNRHAAAYMRQRPYLTPEQCQKWRCGYLPHDTGGDKSGGSMRAKFVYPMLDMDGNVLTWFGRDPQFEEKQRKWIANNKAGREPQKYTFVKGFHRGEELFGQQHVNEETFLERACDLGLIVVEGPNDVIACDALGIPAVGLCSNTITPTQVSKLATIAKKLPRPLVTLMLDCDPQGETGVRQTLPAIAEQVPVQLGWSASMYGGQFKGRQPESLTGEEWQEIQSALQG